MEYNNYEPKVGDRRYYLDDYDNEVYSYIFEVNKEEQKVSYRFADGSSLINDPYVDWIGDDYWDEPSYIVPVNNLSIEWPMTEEDGRGKNIIGLENILRELLDSIEKMKDMEKTIIKAKEFLNEKV